MTTWYPRVSRDVLSVVNCTARRSAVSKIECEVRMAEEDGGHLGVGGEGAERRFDGIEEVEVPLPLRYFKP